MSGPRAAALALVLTLGACGSTSSEPTSVPTSQIANSPSDEGDPAIATAHDEAADDEAADDEARLTAEPTLPEATPPEPTQVEPTPPEPTQVEATQVEATPPEPTQVEPTPSEPTARVADASDVIVAIDTHCDTTQRLLDEHADLSVRLTDGHLDLPRMREGGLTAAFMSIWVDPRRYRGEAAWDRARALVAAVRAFVEAHPREVVLATTADEVRAAAASHRVAFLMGLEGAHGLGEAEPAVLLTRLDELAASGVRYVTITWTNDNVFGHASTGGHPGRGLTDAGRELVRHMNELGVMVDVSHVSDRTALDAIEVSRAPVLASHSGARAIGDHPRNVPDTILRRIRETHGAVCLNYYAQFMDPAYGEARRALEREHRAEFDALPHGRSWTTSAARNALARRLAPELHPPTLRTLGEHFAHVAELAGPEAPCLGSDFDGIGELPRGMDDVSDLPALRRELERRHLDWRAIAGENVLRVMQSVERVAAQ